jgi:hypothetical protein
MVTRFRGVIIAAAESGHVSARNRQRARTVAIARRTAAAIMFCRLNQTIHSNYWCGLVLSLRLILSSQFPAKKKDSIFSVCASVSVPAGTPTHCDSLSNGGRDYLVECNSRC